MNQLQLERYFQTFIHLKPKQIFYNIIVRLGKKVTDVNGYRSLDRLVYNQVQTTISQNLIKSDKKYYSNLQFSFIGITHQFVGIVDWNFNEYGKLWSFNLNYLDFILDDSIAVQERFELLKLHSKELKNVNIPLEPYSTSLRIINTILFLSHYKKEDSIVSEMLKKQIDYLSKNTEKHLLANHLLENAFALFISSYVVRDEKLLLSSKKLLLAELKEQILSDGAHYECTPMYQSILLSKLLICIDIATNNSDWNQDAECLNFLREKATLMLSWLVTFSYPDGSWCLMNDAANDIAIGTNRLIELSAQLQVLVYPVQLGPSGFRKIISDNWQCVIKCGAAQPAYQPAHTHADMLSFGLWYRGHQIVVDKGTSTYENNKQRHLERSTASHNTISCNQQNQSDVWGAFRIGKRAKITLLRDSENLVEATCKVVLRNTYHHKRIFSKNHDELIIEDQFTLSDNSQGVLESRLLLSIPPYSSFKLKNNSLVLSGLSIEFSNMPTVKDEDFSSSFNAYQSGKQITSLVGEFSKIKFTFN